MPAADNFPSVTEPVSPEESSRALAMDLCTGCGVAQLAHDDTVTAEPRGIEPQALRDQAADALQRVADAGWLRGATVYEFGSPHGAPGCRCSPNAVSGNLNLAMLRSTRSASCTKPTRDWPSSSERKPLHRTKSYCCNFTRC